MLKKLVSTTFCMLFVMHLNTLSGECNPVNIIKNPSFAFHSFENHRSGQRDSFRSGNIAFWNTDNPGDIQVVRAGHVPAAARPRFAVDNLAEIRPGKRLFQFFTLPEAGLVHGDRISLLVHGYQPAPDTLTARLRLLKLDSADGEWSPADFGMEDKRTFPKQSRGELVTAELFETSASTTGQVVMSIENAEIKGGFTPDSRSGDSNSINTIGLQIEFFNAGTEPVWVCAPALVRGAAAPEPGRLYPGSRKMHPYYRYIPRTIQKLWKGAPLHIVVMGSSIDRGSANPPLYPYNEDPTSLDFKKPISDCRKFAVQQDGTSSAPPGYSGWWQHYWSYAGRLRQELMCKFNLPDEKILLNFMACDGSCIGESHSGLPEYFALDMPPSPALNGNPAGKTWEELYPGLFARSEGPRPDLVIFGSGANEKTDTPHEAAVFEGAIRWIQRHYPNTEFLFCMFQNCGQYTPNTGDLQALSLRYQIPMLDYGLLADNLLQCCNRYALVPADGHPQAAAHYLWFKTLELAFETWDPIEPGQAQLHLPERMHANTYGWEGDFVSFAAPHPRLCGPRMIIEDTVFNVWCNADSNLQFKVDGVWRSGSRGRPFLKRDLRNSTFTHGNLTLGDRHILEAIGDNATILFADCKVCPNRQFTSIESELWRKNGIVSQPFNSTWGAPYGVAQLTLPPGSWIEIDAAATDISIAYVDQPNAGTLVAKVDGAEKLRCPANQPFTNSTGKAEFLENRRGITGLPFGIHCLRIEAESAPIIMLGAFFYENHR